MLIWLVWRPHFEITVVCPAPISTAPAFLVLLTHCGCNGESLRGQKAQPRKTGRKPHPSTVLGSGSICCYCCLVSQSCLTLCHSMDAACQASLSITNSQSFLKVRSIELVIPSNQLILCHPLLLLPSIPHSFRVFCNELAVCIRWLKYWSFSFSISPSNEYSGLSSFRIDWLTWSCCARDSQESSPTSLFKSINSLALSLLYSPTLRSIHDYWKNHSLDKTFSKYRTS